MSRELQPQEMPLAQRVRPRSLPSQISAALLQPVYFFRTLPTMGETRQWLWVGLLILFLIGFSAVRQQSLTTTAGTGSAPIDFGGAPVNGGDLGGDPFGGGGVPPDFGGLPDVGGGDPTGGGTGTTGNVTSTLTTGIIAASSIFLGWIILTILLSEVSLLRGRAPRLGQNFQISVWSTLPLTLMALLQVLYYAAGGMVGEPGVSGLLDQWSDYPNQPPFVQALILSLASSITIFWFWKLMLLYFGARFALNGRRWSSMLVVISWVVISIVTPVVTGAIKAPEANNLTEEPLPGFEGEVPFDGSSFDPFGDGSSAGGESTGEAPLNGEFFGDAPTDEFSTDNQDTGEFEIQSTEEAVRIP